MLVTGNNCASIRFVTTYGISVRAPDQHMPDLPKSTVQLLSNVHLMLDESQSTLTASSTIVTKPAYACFKVAVSTLAISSSSA